MRAEIVFTARYLDELGGQLSHIAVDRPIAARRMAERVRKVVDLLSDNPRMGRDGRIAGTRELVISRTPYIACYRVTGDRVEMMLFRHGKQRWPKRLPSRAGETP